MAKFDSQYTVQTSPENGDKILIASAQDGSIMALPFGIVMSYIQKYLNQVDDELSTTSEHPLQNKVITQVINDILAQLQPADNKEIISVLTYSGTSPASASAGDLYIDSMNDILKEYIDGAWEDAEAQENVIYITNDTTHFYIYKDDAFVDMTGIPIDNTIYVNNLSELDDYLSEGIYRLCVTTISDRNTVNEWYSFIIEHSSATRSHRIIYTQTLSNRSGYRYRTKHNLGAWSEWEEFIFVSKAELQEVYDLACAGL